jgi:hypothetical protein
MFIFWTSRSARGELEFMMARASAWLRRRRVSDMSLLHFHTVWCDQKDISLIQRAKRVVTSPHFRSTMVSCACLYNLSISDRPTLLCCQAGVISRFSVYYAAAHFDPRCFLLRSLSISPHYDVMVRDGKLERWNVGREVGGADDIIIRKLMFCAQFYVLGWSWDVILYVIAQRTKKRAN